MSKNSWSFPLNKAGICFALAIISPSTAEIQKYFGIVGVIVYILLAVMALGLIARHGVAILRTSVTDKQLSGLIVGTFLMLILTFAAVYPLANAGIVGGGSDRDEALNIATTALLQGHYPYYQKTYLNQPITPLPGSLILATPFVLLGNSAYQNFFWLFMFLISMTRYLKCKRTAMLLLWTILALSPVISQQLLTGGDLLANSLYIMLSILWLIQALQKTETRVGERTLFAILVGMALASRPNFILLLPLICSALIQVHGIKVAMPYCVIISLTLGLLTIPFYGYDPQGFSPLHTINKLEQFQTTVPFIGLIIPLATGLIIMVLSFSKANRSLPILFRNSTLVLAFPILSAVILHSISNHNLHLNIASYGLSFLFFGAVAYWPPMLNKMSYSTMED